MRPMVSPLYEMKSPKMCMSKLKHAWLMASQKPVGKRGISKQSKDSWAEAHQIIGLMKVSIGTSSVHALQKAAVE